MDELDLLKKDWKRQEKNLPYVSSSKIYQMMHKKSISLVKWIFIISILEFFVWLSIEIFANVSQSNNILEELNLTLFYRVLTTVNYIIILLFIFLFFKNYSTIKSDDSIKKLMKNIIKTRSTVKAYVWFNVILFTFSSIVISYTSYSQISTDESWQTKVLFIGSLLLLIGVFVLLIILFYKLLYGIITKRLYKNYKVLMDLEEE